MARNLHRAAANGDDEVLMKALAKGANVDDLNSDGATPLLFAAYRGRTETVRLLLDHGANVKAGNCVRYTPLMVASREGWPETVQLLIDRGALINAQTDDGWTALMFAIQYSPNLDTIEVLLGNTVDLTLRRNSGGTTLMIAAWVGKVNVIERLLQLGDDVNAKRADGKSAFTLALERNHTEAAELLVRYGAHT